MAIFEIPKQIVEFLELENFGTVTVEDIDYMGAPLKDGFRVVENAVIFQEGNELRWDLDNNQYIVSLNGEVIGILDFL